MPAFKRYIYIYDKTTFLFTKKNTLRRVSFLGYDAYVCMYMCPIPNGFRDRAISLYSSKIVDKKEILRTVSNTGIYCLSAFVQFT
jgi:hypothetical protein